MKVSPNIRKERSPMQEHFHFTTDPAKLQKQYAAIFCFVSAQLSLIQMYLHRRNRHLVKTFASVKAIFINAQRKCYNA
ncbi:Transposase [Geobacillus sp. WSUCF1]|nr:Transposase [Geobacillus sp. WSUCF1]